MIDLIVAGGPLFTIPLTVIAVAVVGIGIWATVAGRSDGGRAEFWRRTLFHLGLLAFVLGILSQAVSLSQMMSAIEGAGGVSPAIVVGGLKMSMIAPLYGVIVFVVALLFRLGLDLGTGRAEQAAS